MSLSRNAETKRTGWRIGMAHVGTVNSPLVWNKQTNKRDAMRKASQAARIYWQHACPVHTSGSNKVTLTNAHRIGKLHQLASALPCYRRWASGR
jgi:hypothetical protein